jgi:hypothetical protein
MKVIELSRPDLGNIRWELPEHIVQVLSTLDEVQAEAVRLRVSNILADQHNVLAVALNAGPKSETALHFIEQNYGSLADVISSIILES